MKQTDTKEEYFHKGSGWSSDETTEITFEQEYIVISIREERRRRYKTIKFRNVGELNIESAIQFEITEINGNTNRTKSVSFSIPLSLSEIFLTKLATVKTHKP